MEDLTPLGEFLSAFLLLVAKLFKAPPSLGPGRTAHAHLVAGGGRRKHVIELFPQTSPVGSLLVALGGFRLPAWEVFRSLLVNTVYLFTKTNIKK